MPVSAMYSLIEVRVLSGCTQLPQAVVTGVAHDRQQPCPPISPSKAGKVADRAHVCRLHCVFRLGFVAHQVTSQIVCRVYMVRQQYNVPSVWWQLAWASPGTGRQGLLHNYISSLVKILRLIAEWVDGKD